MQNGQPVSYASRALTETEQQYAQIEKEMLAIAYGLDKFHNYTYGRRITVETDHKPIETIHRKPLHTAPKRLQRMLMRVQQYDINIQYKQGKQMLLADTLSRAYITDHSTSINQIEKTFEQVDLSQHIPLTTEKISEIKVATKEDETLQQLLQTIKTGWPDYKQQVPWNSRQYFHARDEPVCQDGVIYKGNRLLIPTSMRAKFMSRIHSSHLGTNSCILRARECVYWPGITSKIKIMSASVKFVAHTDVHSNKKHFRVMKYPTNHGPKWELIFSLQRKRLSANNRLL